jgi:anti-anti-sigma factor
MREVLSGALEGAVRAADCYPCVCLSGEGGTGGAEELEKTFDRLLAEGHTHLVLDTRELRFLDPRCFDTLEAIIRRVEEEGGMLVIVDQTLPVERTLKLLNLEEHAHVVPSISQAAAYLAWNLQGNGRTAPPARRPSTAG